MNRGCPLCAQVNRGIKRRLKQEEYISRAIEKHNGKFDYSKVNYQGWDSYVTIICPEHGEFKQKAGKHLMGDGCPKCNQSSLEKTISQWLTYFKINYIPQKKFDWLKYYNPLSLDFYLPDYNIAIECQGEQHFKPVKCFGGEEQFIIIQKRDVRKRQLCMENGVKLLYYSNLGINYPYQVYENLDELLKEIKD